MLTRKILYTAKAKDNAHYYSDQKEDYYAKEGDSHTWFGKGAAALNLHGDVKFEDFLRVLRGEIISGRPRPPKAPNGSRTRAGLDLTFSAPKSVSLQALVGNDKSMIDAHDHAVKTAMQYLETRAQARLKTQGKSRRIDTESIVAALFRHETARETPDAPPDPGLHTHVIIANLTQLPDGRWRAMSNEALMHDLALAGRIYMATLAKEVERAGKQIRWVEKGNFELAHIPDAYITASSKRSKQIEDDLADRGLTRQTATRSEKQASNLRTRQAKTNTWSRSELDWAWRQQANHYQVDFHRTDWHGVGKTTNLETDITGPEAHQSAVAVTVQWAIQHLSEREAVMSESLLKATALQHGAGLVSLAEVQEEITNRKKAGHLIEGETRYASASYPELPALTRREWAMHIRTKLTLDEATAYRHVRQGITEGRLVPKPTELTTVEARRREQSILAMELAGRGKLSPISDPRSVADTLSTASLTGGQRASVEHVLVSTDRFVGVEGHAGTGKTHMLRQAISQMETNGYNVIALAPYGNQARALRELGVESGTVAAMLRARDKDRFTLNEKSVVIIDEAGVLPAVDAVELMRKVEQAGARAILLGDRQQTKAIQAGAPFAQLINAGMPTAYMTEVVRQKAEKLRRAVELAAGGEPTRSLKLIDNVISVKNTEARYARIATDYVGLAPEERDTTLVVTGTNDSRRQINERIREQLGLSGKGKVYTLLSRHDSSQAERRHSRYFEIGDIIQAERTYQSKGLHQHETYRVIDNGPGNQLTVSDRDGNVIRFNPKQVQKISVYKQSQTELAVGDWVRATRNFAKHDIANGNRLRVTSIQEDKIELEFEGRKIALDTDKPLHLDLAYVTTIHSSQGMTFDRVMANFEENSATTKDDVYYVAISRGRSHVNIYTDNKSKLPGAISRESKKTTSLEIGKQKAAPRLGKNSLRQISSEASKTSLQAQPDKRRQPEKPSFSR